MPKARHYPPSRRRYEQAHPTISVRVSRELYSQLKRLKERSGKSVGDVLREAVKAQAPSSGDAYNRGYRRGSKEAEELYRVDYRCSGCGGTLPVTTVEEKQAAASCMRESGWAHGSCLE